MLISWHLRLSSSAILFMASSSLPNGVAAWGFRPRLNPGQIRSKTVRRLLPIRHFPKDQFHMGIYYTSEDSPSISVDWKHQLWTVGNDKLEQEAGRLLIFGVGYPGIGEWTSDLLILYFLCIFCPVDGQVLLYYERTILRVRVVHILKLLKFGAPQPGLSEMLRFSTVSKCGPL